MRVSVAYVALAVLFAALVAMTFRDITRPFGNGDEIVYAQGIREMVASGDYLTLHWFGEPVLERPTTAFVVPALLSQVIDYELGLRLFSVLCSL
ncbi:MAG: hypothetical protein KJO07_25135, partial [Deltaproteobacteria bacterium]|nr:hypothetical protein [Deltaproteobacteria bacterium]